MILRNSILFRIFCSLVIVLTPVFSFANPSLLVTEVKKDQPAPFEGILLSKDTAAKLFADIKFSKKECDALLSEKLELQSIQLNSKIDSLNSIIDIEKKRTTSLMKIKDDRIDFLEKNYRAPAWYESNEMWLGVGVIAGIGITALAGYAIGQVK